MKILVKILIVFALLFALNEGQKRWHKHFGTFKLNKIYTSSEWNLPVKKGNEDLASTLLEQQFRYLSMGNQVYVFESADQKHVLKILKQHKFRKPFWRDLFPFFDGSKFRHFKRWVAEERMEKALTSYKIAYEIAGDESAIVFAHLNKTQDFPYKMHLLDSLGRKFEVKGDDVVFVIQKKGEIFTRKIRTLLAQNNYEEIEKLFVAYLKMERSFLQKGVADSDARMCNTAVVDGKIIKIDVGNFFTTNPKEHNFQEDLSYETRKMRLWLQEKTPGLLALFEETVKKEEKQ